MPKIEQKQIFGEKIKMLKTRNFKLKSPKTIDFSISVQKWKSGPDEI